MLIRQDSPRYGQYAVNANGLLVPTHIMQRKGEEPIDAPVMRKLTLSEDCEFGRAGQTITLAVTPAEVGSVNRDVETYLGGYTAPEMGADLFSNINLVDQETGIRRDFSSANLYTLHEDRVGRQGALNEIEHLSETTSYTTEEHGLAAFVTWGASNAAHPLYDVKAAHSETIAHALLLNREVRVFTSLTTTGNWNASNYTTLATTYRWDTGSGTTTADPILDLTRRAHFSYAPITAWGMNPWVAYWFLSNSKVAAQLKNVWGDAAPKPDMAFGARDTLAIRTIDGIPGVAPIHIIPSQYVDSSGVKQYCLGNSVVGVHNPLGGLPRDGKRLSTHMTFRVKGKSGTGWQVNEYMPNGRGLNGGTMYETGFQDGEFFGSNKVGGLITNVLATALPT